MKEPQAPCLFCDEKHVGCHIECEKYNSYKEQHHKWSEAVKAEKTKEHELTRMEIERYRR